MDGASSSSNSSSDFVRKLYKMLEDPSYDSVVRWGNDGDSFVVLENDKFTKTILPKHFKHSNFASFVRQLNKYDFHKVRHNNEAETGASPYGAGAWEFRHPDFKVNNRDALDNIRRKAPAPRKSNQASTEEATPTQQMDLVNTQLVATQQQLQTLQDRYNDLSAHHTMLLQEVIGLQKTVVNHEHVIQNVMSFLHSVDAQRRRDSRVTNPFAHMSENGMDDPNQQAGQDEDEPASPLQHATKLLNEVNADVLLNSKALEHMNEMSMRMNGAFAIPSPSDTAYRNGRPPSRNAAPASATSTSSMRMADIDTLVYPVGANNGIDPMYSEHVHNIPYPMPSRPPEPTDPRFQQNEQRKKDSFDPGWIRQPQILLVEDDATCRRIGGKFLYAFNCSIDSALDGLEAVNKLNAGSKYDLVLMDIIMPNLDGVSACHLIRGFDATPIIAMTSNIRSDDIAMYFQHGMNDVLPKPFTKEGLLSMLEKHLSHLKKPGSEIDRTGGSVGSVVHSSTRQSLKEDESPKQSPALSSTWNSPANAHGISPAASSATDEYGQPVPYNMMSQGPMGYSTGLPQPQSSGPHRRQLSDISGGAEDPRSAKRQMYVPPMHQQGMGSMSGPRSS